MLILGPPVSGFDLLAYDIAFAAVLWFVAGIVLVPSRALPPGMNKPHTLSFVRGLEARTRSSRLG